MQEQVSVTAYRVAKSGFYRRGATEPAFGSFAETAAAVAQWVSDKQVRNTSTQVVASGADADEEALLCCDFAEMGGDYLFQMWDRSGSEGGAIAGLPAEGVVGQATSQELSMDAGQIPGAGRLFWLIPSLNALCTVRLQGSTARPRFERYILSFMRYVSPWTVNRVDGDEVVTYAYAPPGAEVTERVAPRFELDLIPDLSRLDEIRRRRLQIRQVLYTGEMNIGEARETLDDATGILRNIMGLAAHIGFQQQGPRALLPQFKVSVKLPYTPSEPELEALIQEAVGRSGMEPARVGFLLGDDPSPTWIDAKRVQEKASLDVSRVTRAQIHPEALLSQLRNRFAAKLQARAAAQ